MGLEDDNGNLPVTSNVPERSEHITAFIEVLRESMGQVDLSDDAILEFARSTEFKELFPELVAGIPEFDAILNEGIEGHVVKKEVEDEDIVPNKKDENDSVNRMSKINTTSKGNENLNSRDHPIEIDSDGSSVVALSDTPPKDSKGSVSHAKSQQENKDKQNSKLENKDKENNQLEKKEKQNNQLKRENEMGEKENKGKDDKKTKQISNPPSTTTTTNVKPPEHYPALTKIPRKSKNWKPFLDEDYQKYKKKFKLETHSVIICNLKSFKSIFHGPGGADPAAPLFSATVPLQHNMRIAPEKAKLINGVERSKRTKCKEELNKIVAAKNRELKKKKEVKATRYSSSESDNEEGFKNFINAKKKKEAEKRLEKRRKSDSSDDERTLKKRKRNKRQLASSSDSDEPVVSKKNKTEKREVKETKKPEKKKDQKKPKRKEEPVKIPPNLKWEKKPDYYVQERDDKEVVNKVASPRKIISISKLLAQAQAEVRRTAQDVKSSVTLKIPENSAKPAYTAPVTSINLSDISNQVKKILCQENVVEMPVMGDTRHLYDITVQKIAWWFLKWENDPPEVEIIHPELHDIVYEAFRDGYESDGSSVGHVSDPEGLHKPVYDPNQIIDADVADEYCGFRSLDNQIRYTGEGAEPPYENLWHCFKVKPSTNYFRASFQAKCKLCNQIITGARGLGKHIRSTAHANSFRNVSLNIANYTEVRKEVQVEKIFKATLKNYGRGEECQPDLPDYLLKSMNPSSTLVSSAKVIFDESSSFYDIKENVKLLEFRNALTKHGRWTYYSEQKWNQANEDEKKIISAYLETREKYKKSPELHPRYAEEWNEFWYNRYDELEAAGQNAETYNFESEWKTIKVSKILRIFKEETEAEITEMREKTHMDYKSLQKLMNSFGIKTENKPVAPPLPLLPLPVANPPLPSAPPPLPSVPPPHYTVAPPLPLIPSPLPYVRPPLPSCPPPQPNIPASKPVVVQQFSKRPPSPPKISEMFEETTEKRKEMDKRKENQPDRSRRTSPSVETNYRDADEDHRRKGSQSKGRDRKRSRSKERRRERRSRSRNRSRSKEKESHSRNRSRSKEKRSHHRHRDSSRSKERRTSKDIDRKTRKEDSRSDRRHYSSDNEPKTIEVGRSNKIPNDSQCDTEVVPATASVSASEGLSPVSIPSQNSFSKAYVPSGLSSPAVSFDAFELGTTKVTSFLGKISGVSRKAIATSNNSASISDQPGYELEDGEIDDDTVPPGTEEYVAPPLKSKPDIPSTQATKPMKRAPPPPILSGSNSLSSISSSGRQSPKPSSSLLATPHPSGTQTAVRGRGAGWTQSYRGGSHVVSSPTIKQEAPIGQAIPTYTTSTFRGRILHRGASSQRGRGFSQPLNTMYPQNLGHTMPDNPYYSNNSLISHEVATPDNFHLSYVPPIAFSQDTSYVPQPEPINELYVSSNIICGSVPSDPPGDSGGW